MIDWTSSMQQTFEYYVVDSRTWNNTKQITTITSSTINRDSKKETLGSASFDCTEPIDECYVRVYLVATQNGITEKFPLGTFLVQTPSTNFDGLKNNISLDAYTPLIELKEKPTPIGYSILKETKLMELASKICSENLRAPIVSTKTDDIMGVDFVSYLTDNWLSFISEAINSIQYEFALDEMGRVLFNRKQKLEALKPVWEYTDDNSSILLPGISINRDLYGIPNVVEAISGGLYARVSNTDPNSPVSIPSRGREITHRVTDPNITGTINIESLTEYANNLLKELSAIEYTVSYTHGYCPVRLGDAVRLRYTRAGITNVIAKVISQSISCEPGCPVAETAVYNANLWR